VTEIDNENPSGLQENHLFIAVHGGCRSTSGLSEAALAIYDMLFL
jgi:hypothetical protein